MKNFIRDYISFRKKEPITPTDAEKARIYKEKVKKMKPAIINGKKLNAFAKYQRLFKVVVRERREKVDDDLTTDAYVDMFKDDIFDNDETSDAENDDVKAVSIGGKLDKDIDYHIDNHVTISHVINVGKRIEVPNEDGIDTSVQIWQGNHVFTNVRQFLESDLKTCYDTVRSDYMKINQVVVENDAYVEGSTDPLEANKYKVEEKRQFKNTPIPQYENFGDFPCYVCHAETEWPDDPQKPVLCKFSGTDITFTRYSKMEKEYPRIKRLGTTENAILQPSIYPEKRSNRKLKNTAQNLKDTDEDYWCRDQNMMWNYRNGFDAMLAERDRLRFLYSMATVEHYFKQQKVQLVKYNYNVIRDKKLGPTLGELHIRRKINTNDIYALNERSRKWNELVWPQTDNNWAPSLGKNSWNK